MLEELWKSLVKGLPMEDVEKAKETPEPVNQAQEIWGAVEGCVIDWQNSVQVNPKTGEKYDFRGNKLQ